MSASLRVWKLDLHLSDHAASERVSHRMVWDGPGFVIQNADGNYKPACAGRTMFGIDAEKEEVFVLGVQHPLQQIRLVSFKSKTWLLLTCRTPQHWIPKSSSM